MTPSNVALVLLMTLAPIALAADPMVGRLPLTPLESAALPIDAPDGQFPLLTLGALTPTAKSAPNAARPRALTEMLSNGQKVLTAPQAGKPLVFALVGPTLNSYEFFEPVSLTRTGNDLTLRIESWTDGRPRRKNIPSRSTHFVSAPALDAGDYTLRVEILNFFSAAATGSPLYGPKGLRAATTRFIVAAAANDLPITLADAALKAEPAPATPARQYITHAVVDLEGRRDTANPGLQIGSFDRDAWLASNPKSLDQLPTLAPPDRNAQIYAVIQSPPLDSGNWITPGPVEWHGSHCTLHVYLWHDSAYRLQNQIHTPILIVPLTPIVRLPGDYKVTLQWDVLKAPQPGGLYAPDPDAKIVKQSTNDVTFTLNK